MDSVKLHESVNWNVLCVCYMDVACSLTGGKYDLEAFCSSHRDSLSGILCVCVRLLCEKRGRYYPYSLPSVEAEVLICS